MFEGLRKGADRGHAEAALNALSGRAPIAADSGLAETAALVEGQISRAGSGHGMRALNASSGQDYSAGSGHSPTAALKHEAGQITTADRGHIFAPSPWPHNGRNADV